MTPSLRDSVSRRFGGAYAAAVEETLARLGGAHPFLEEVYGEAAKAPPSVFTSGRECEAREAAANKKCDNENSAGCLAGQVSSAVLNPDCSLAFCTCVDVTREAFEKRGFNADGGSDVWTPEEGEGPGDFPELGHGDIA